jgi:hypothetical protein
MLLETLTLDKATALAMPAAKKIFENSILPIIKSKASSYFKNKSSESKFESSMTKYLAKVAGQCATINTIAFQNSPKKLDDLYIPLTLQGEGKKDIIVVRDNVDIFSKSNHILINDTAGMGKSTLSKKVVANVISEGIFIPIFIEMRQIEEKPFEEQILGYLGVSKDLGCEFLKNFNLMYVFDGMDEIPLDKKKKIVSLLKKFVEDIGDARILITSRQETFLSDFYSFSQYHIRRLEQTESFDLLKKYDPEGSISGKLIASVSRSSSSLREFLSTPLYVSLLFCAYRYKTVIPRRKDLFYSQVYEALFESHDLSKEIGFVRPKFSKLDSADFHAVLRRLGFWCMTNNGQIEFQKDELEIVLSELLGNMSGFTTKAPDVAKDLVTTVPLFVKEGATIRWSHKSLMEYFAAMFICNDSKGKQQTILLHYFNSESLLSQINILALCADIDFSSFRASILREILKNFKKHCNKLQSEFGEKKISKEALDLRMGLTFGSRCAFRVVNIQESAFVSKVEENGEHLNVDIIYHLDDKSELGVQVGYGHDGIKRMLSVLKGRLDIFWKAPEIGFVTGKSLSSFKNSSFKLNKIYNLNFEKTNKVNVVRNFDAANYLLFPYDKLVLDRTAALKELADIEKDCSNGVNDLLKDLL